jgi:adenosine kinase
MIIRAMAGIKMSHPLVCLGHPLLDISAVVDLSVFEKYGVKTGSACLATPEHIPLYKELVDEHQCDFIAGGAAQNSCRAAQWISRTQNFAAFLGAVGADDYSNRLRQAAEAAGVHTYYQVENVYPTGTCAVLIHEKERSLVANLAASEHLTMEHVRSHWGILENSQVVYVEGYLLTSAPDVIYEIAKFTSEAGKIFSINVSAQFIVEFFKDNMMRVWPYCEYVFGNEDEVQKFGEVHGLGNDVIEIAKGMSTMPTSTSRPKKIVVTRGKHSVVIAQEGNISEFSVPAIEEHRILDLNGAGDSFVGGFLFELIRGAAHERCVAAGNYLAGEVIQRSGCSFPEVVNYQ